MKTNTGTDSWSMESLDERVFAKYWIPAKVVPTFKESNSGGRGVGN